jgi:hypothetical protein
MRPNVLYAALGKPLLEKVLLFNADAKPRPRAGSVGSWALAILKRLMEVH